MRFDLSHLFISSFCSEVLSAVIGGGESALNARSKSITPRTIMTLSFQDLKFEPLSKGIEFMLAVMFAGSVIAELRTTNKQNMLKLILKIKVMINSNIGKSHYKISGIR
jgi:hypothetical protein